MLEWRDAHGHALYDYFKDESGYVLVERDDRYINPTLSAGIYFTEYDEWPEYVKKALQYVRGTVLDIGCGAGRHSLWLQEKGFEVTGIDVSPLTVEVCKLRGLKKVEVLPIADITPELGVFDTIIMFGNNFGLVESFDKARWFLEKLQDITTERGRIIAESRDPYQTKVPEHLEYHEFNRKKGRMAGQLRLRTRYKKYMDPWFDYLIVSKEEMKGILKDTGWSVKKFIDGEDGMYVAVIDKRD
ncbi:MAG: class I SAM-dependent methyltransferase [Theionarchaea archaeon]|nr:class I SAM-dependent methyltransferase [Theionarchaea archaeon]